MGVPCFGLEGVDFRATSLADHSFCAVEMGKAKFGRDDLSLAVAEYEGTANRKGAMALNCSGRVKWVSVSVCILNYSIVNFERAVPQCMRLLPRRL